MYPSLPRGIAGALLVALAGCYDAPRTNPFDPALTPAVELLSVTVDNTSGSTTLEWTPYEGKQPFAEYRVLRQVKRLVDVDTVAVITNVRQTSFRDTTPEPEVEYAYWVEVVNQGGFEVESGKQEGVVYALPPVSLLEAEFSSDTATAELIWTQYRGPGFAAYEVRRRTPGLVEETVTTLDEVSDTTYTDSLLDGNTEYTYRIAMRTEWEGAGVSSNEKSGRFYPFDHSFELPEVPGAEPQAVGLAVDEQDHLYVGMTMSSEVINGIVQNRVMNNGIWIRFPEGGLRPFFSEILPHVQSPIQLAVGQGVVYGSVSLKNDTTLVWALDTEGQVIWADSVDTGGVFLIGLHLEPTGEVVMVDTQGLFYSFQPSDRQVGKPKRALPALMNIFQILSLGQAVLGPEAPGSRNWFALAPDHSNNHVWGYTQLPSGIFDVFQRPTVIDEGIGTQKGQTLNPIALAFDRQRQRLLVLEEQGRMQVFDVAPNSTRGRRYITQWGRFGPGEGEFLVAPPTNVAVTVDSQGMIYIADGAGRIQVFGP